MAIHYFTGPCEWAKVLKPDEKYHKFSIDLMVDEKTYEKYKALGLKHSKKETDGGSYRITFRRDPEKMAWVDKKQVLAGPPKVTDPSGKPWDKMIGNGSVVTVKIDVYPYDNKFGKGFGHRLEAVRVDNWVEYKPVDVTPNTGSGVTSNDGTFLPF